MNVHNHTSRAQQPRGTLSISFFDLDEALGALERRGYTQCPDAPHLYVSPSGQMVEVVQCLGGEVELKIGSKTGAASRVAPRELAVSWPSP